MTEKSPARKFEQAVRSLSTLLGLCHATGQRSIDGQPTQLPDGSVQFWGTKIRKDVEDEVRKVLRLLGATKDDRGHAREIKVFTLSPEAIGVLGRMAGRHSAVTTAPIVRNESGDGGATTITTNSRATVTGGGGGTI